MRIDWSTQPWWVRPALALSVGLAIGLVLNAFLNLFNGVTASIMLLVVCGLALAYCVWALYDLRKMKREFVYQVEQLEKTGRLPRGTLAHRRRFRRRYRL